MKKFLFLLLVCVLVMSSGCSIKKTEELTNSEKFDNEYAVGENNPFVYITISELETVLDNGTGIVFFGNSDCEWCLNSVEMFNELLLKNDITEVYYLNPAILSDKKKDKLLYLMNEEIENVEITEIAMPSVYVFKDGMVVDYCDETFSVSSDDDGTFKENEKKLKKKYKSLIEVYKEQI